MTSVQTGETSEATTTSSQSTDDQSSSTDSTSISPGLTTDEGTEDYCSRFDTSCLECLKADEGRCFYYWPEMNCFSKPDLKKCELGEKVQWLEYLGIGFVYRQFCNLQFRPTNQTNKEQEFKITDISTNNCLLTNGTTFIFYILLAFLSFVIILLITCELKTCILRNRNSSKFQTKKRFEDEFPKGWAFEMQEKGIPSTRSNQILRKHGVNFVQSNQMKSDATSDASSYLESYADSQWSEESDKASSLKRRDR